MLALFAQVAGNGNFNNDDDEISPEDAITFVVVFGAILVAWLLVSFFFLNTLYKTLYLCRAKNRTMEPGAVWLNLIPLFNLVWLFVTVVNVADSLENEFRSRGLRTREGFSKGLGIALGIFSVLNCGCYVGGLIPLVLFIVYWSKIAGYKNQLSERGYEDDEEDRLDDEEERDRRDESEDSPRKREGEDEDDRPRRSQREWKFEDEEDDRPRKRRTEYGDHDDEHLK